MHYSLLTRALIALALTAGTLSCSQQPLRPQTADNAAPEPLPKTTVEANQRFDETTLYTLLTAEVALARGRFDLGLSNYVQQAKRLRDVNVSARATQIARILKRHPESLEMAELWHELDPGSAEARYVLVGEYIHSQRFQAAFMQAQALLNAGHPAGFEDIAIDATEKSPQQLSELREGYRSLLQTYPQNSELLIGASVMAQAQDELPAALDYIERALDIKPDSGRGTYQYFRVLYALGRKDEALATYAELVELQPDNNQIRARYARMLLEHAPDQALEQYQKLYDADSGDDNVLLTLALLQLERGAYRDAEVHFNALLSKPAQADLAHYGLGEIALANGDKNRALEHYKDVHGGPRYVSATAKAADLLASLAGWQEARRFLTERRADASAPQKEDLFLVETNVLINSGLHDDAEISLNRALEQFPDSVKLLYARAMQRAAQDEIAAAETDFLRILDLVPDNAATLNALGYTLLTQTNRIGDAEVYIRKAHTLDTDEPAIIDSLGWLEYRLGNTEAALQHLQRAFDMTKDDEIASHLGEVLWQSGQRRKARQVWQQALEMHPDSQPVLNTLKRLNIKRSEL